MVIDTGVRIVGCARSASGPFLDRRRGRKKIECEEQDKEKDHGEHGAGESEGCSVHGLLDKPGEKEK